MEISNNHEYGTREYQIVDMIRQFTKTPKEAVYLLAMIAAELAAQDEVA